jgi:hypothetical protein
MISEVDLVRSFDVYYFYLPIVFSKLLHNCLYISLLISAPPVGFRFSIPFPQDTIKIVTLMQH